MRTTDDDAHYSAKALAKRFGKNYHRLRKQLERWRPTARYGYDWKVVNDPAGGEGKYLYRLGSVRKTIDGVT